MRHVFKFSELARPRAVGKLPRSVCRSTLAIDKDCDLLKALLRVSAAARRVPKVRKAAM